MEVVRILKNLNYKPKNTIRAVLFMNEENGGKGGAKYEEVSKQKKENTIDSDGNTFERLKKPDLFAFVDDIRNRKTCNLFDKEENTKAFSTLMVLRFLSQKIYPIVRKAQWDKNINKFGEPTYSKGPDAEDIFICNEVNMRWQTMEPKDVYWFLLHTIEKDEIILRIAKYFQCSFKRAREYHNLCGQPFEDYINKKFGDTKLSEEG